MLCVVSLHPVQHEHHISGFLVCMCLQSPCLHRLSGHTGCFLLPQSCSPAAGPPGSCTVGGGGHSALLPRDSAVLRYCIDPHLLGQELEEPQLLPVLTSLTLCPRLTTAGLPCAHYVSYWKAPKWPLPLPRVVKGNGLKLCDDGFRVGISWDFLTTKVG